MSGVPRVELAPGYAVPRLVNGGWQLSAGHRPDGVDRRRALADLRKLAEAGLDTFDSADIHSGVESLLGELAAECRAGGGPEIRVHTELVPDPADLPDLDRTAVESVIDRSLRRLGVERLDLVQLHWWDFEVAGWVEVAGWLDDLRRAGKIRHLGVTNFDAARLERLLDAGLPVVSNQVQYSLLDRRPAGSMAELCERRGVALLAYGTLAGGFLGPRWHGRPAPERAPNRSLSKYRLIVDEAGGWGQLQSLLDVLAAIAGRRGASIANVALAWVLGRPGVAAAVVGARDAAHLADNLRTFRVGLDAADRWLLERVLREASGPRGPVYGLERVPGGRHAAITRTDQQRSGVSG